MADYLDIMGWVGSLRKASYNRMLMQVARASMPPGMDIRLFDLGNLPLYNDDLAAEDSHAGVTDFRHRLQACDGLLIASPEYNFSITPLIKNAIDWASTNTLGNIINDKPAAMMGASNGNFGTTRGQLHLRQVLHAANARVVPRPEVLVRRAGEVFASDGRLLDPALQDRIRTLLASLVELIRSRND
jgi:chromate reductase